jgi:thiamine kinase-like enzyme
LAKALIKNSLEMFEGVCGAEHMSSTQVLNAVATLDQRQEKHDVARLLKKLHQDREEVDRERQVQRRTVSKGVEEAHRRVTPKTAIKPFHG